MRHRRTAPSPGRRPLLSPLLPGERTRNAWQLDSGAAIGVATAQLYPTITLSASWTLQTATAGVLFDTSIFISNLTAGLTTPLFHGGALEAQRRATIDAFDAQLGDYRQTVLQAFGHVADVLRALQHDARSCSRPSARL